jgi:hypothetical protein
MTHPADRVVFDCVVYAQTMMSSRGPSAACVELARQKHIALAWGRQTIEEIRELPAELPARF